MKHLKVWTKEDVLTHTNSRRFVTRLGEKILVTGGTGELEKTISESDAKYVLFGIPEDIGVRANMGIGGTDTAWALFISSFLNLQSNDFFSGEDILLLGHFNFNDLKFLIEEKAYDEKEKINAYRHAVNTIDDEVEQLAKIIAACRKIPVVIGGGHNNAYPLIKGTAKGLHKAGVIPLAQINAINLDAHADLRPIEGRHSGNGFRYAEEDGYLFKYFVLGLHESHLPQNVLQYMEDSPFIRFASFEDIFIREKQNFIQAIATAVHFTEEGYTGIELDLDCLENVLASATTPSGISTIHARQYVNFTGERCNPAYLHLCEGAAILEDGQKSFGIGKLISYLVCDFIKRF